MEMRAKRDQERELALRARGGDRQATELLLRQTMPMALNMVRSYVRHREDVDDLLQAVLLSIWNSIRGLRDPDAYRPWVARIVHYRVMDHLRRQQREVVNIPVQRGVDLDEIPTEEDAAQFGAHLYRLLAGKIEAGISNGGEEYRKVLTLHLLQGKTYQEIAGETGKKVGTVKSLVSRGKKRLLTEMEKMI